MTNVLPPANAYTFAIGKQTNGTTALGTAGYSMPVYDADNHITQELAEIVVTDASSIEGDKYVKPSYWESSVTVPALAASMGRLLSSIWGTDTHSGTADPVTHPFTGLGGTQPFVGLFDDFSNASKPMSYANGIASEISFAATADDPVLKIGWKGIGSTPTQATYTVTTADTVDNGYFTLQKSGATIELDLDTPNSNPSSAVTNVEELSITVSRNVTPQPTADGIAVTNMAQGKVVTTGSMTLLYDSWQAWLATWSGAVAGTTASSTICYGALDLNFKHTVQSGWSFELYAPKVAFRVPTRTPDASGGPLKFPVELVFAKPSSGDRLQPTLINGVTGDY